LSYWGYWYLTGNIHEVIPQQVIRSASLTPTQLKRVIENYHIKTIIDLAPSGKNYQHELKLSQATNVQHIELPMRAHGLPPIETLKQLTQILSVVERPVLIHCYQGADRTGLGSAIVLALAPQATAVEIKRQYSLIYGAVSPTSIGKRVMHYYFAWLRQHHWQSTPQNFLNWLQQLQVGKAYPYDPRKYHN
jgi:protein tyrosine/serine phosphatase